MPLAVYYAPLARKKTSPKGKLAAARILQRLISALPSNKRIKNVLS